MTSYDKESGHCDPSQCSGGSQGTTQCVAPLNGQKETQWCILALVIVLLSGGVGILFNQAPIPEAAQHLTLNTEDKAMLTSLSNAITEIRFFRQMDEQWPGITALQEQMVSPFDTTADRFQWLAPNPGCYIGISLQQASSFLLIIPASDQSPGELYTRQGNIDHPDCHEPEHWQLQMTEF